jgi:ketosteroid isomerase-like protein
MADVKDLMRDWLDLIENCRFDERADRVARDVVLRFPFAAPGVAEEVRGFDAAKEYLEKFIRSLKIFRWLDVEIVRTEDPDLAVGTARSEAVAGSGVSYANKYVFLVRFRNGQVIEHIAYSNPLPVTKSFGDDPRAKF